MDRKDSESWDKAQELENAELSQATGGAAGSKSVPSQGGGDEQPSPSTESELDSPGLKDS